MTIHVSVKHKKLLVPAQDALVNIFAGSQHVTFEGNKYIVVDHGVDEAHLLRNFGYDVPLPILTHYDWRNGTPFEIQKQTSALMSSQRRCYVLNEFGTGKTRSALWAWDYLYSCGQATKLLVVAPLSTLSLTWGREVFATLPHRKVAVLHGTKKKRQEKLAEDADVYVINHDGIGVLSPDLNARINDINCLVLDELAVYRNPTAKRTKAMRKFAANFKWVWGMTGSPTPNEPTDAWAQCSIITPKTVPDYYKRWREELMTKVSDFKWVPKRDAIDKVYEAMQPSVRFTLDDVVELPDLIERTIDIDMGKEQKRVYDTMMQHARVMAQSHEITALNAGAVLMKLLQISTGYVYTRDGRTVSLDNDMRLQALVDNVNASAHKVIVFCPFKHTLAGVAKRLTDEGNSVGVVSGDTPKGERDIIFGGFQNGTEPRVLVAHPACMSHGLTLTAADTIIWFGPTSSLETFEQANARIRRVGQHHKQQILMFQSTLVEKRMYAKLRAKQNVQNQLLDLFEEASGQSEN
jgi:SNF2 family DNA or RNA helicase